MISIKHQHDLAVKAINSRDYVTAHGHCVQIIKQQPDHADAYFLLGIINSEIGQFKKAIQLIEKAISFDENVEYFAHLAKCFSLTGNMSSAKKAVEFAPVDKVEQSLALDTLGVALSRIGEHETALSYFTKALLKVTSNAGYYYNYAVSLKFSGRFEQAKAMFEKAIDLRPDYYQAHFALSDLGGISPEYNHVPRLNELASQQLSVDASLHIGHALAKEYQALGDFDKAMKALAQSKKQKLQSHPYNFENDRVLFDCIRDNQFNLQSVDASNNRGYESDSPIFIVGMPRSGTTLVERIISSHSDVRSCGELQDFGVAVKELTETASNKVLDVETLHAANKLDFNELGRRYIERTRAIVGNKKHFVDKLPFNFFYIGLIRRALPNAKIVCLLRNPMDTCIGNYRQLFSINSPYYAYSYDLLTTGRFYTEFYRLVQEWQRLEIPNFKVLNYEKLVANPENEIRDLIDFCGLGWQQQCLHAEQNTAPVSTASKVQVREPINSKSIGRWKKFQPHTDDLESFFMQQDIPIT